MENSKFNEISKNELASVNGGVHPLVVLGGALTVIGAINETGKCAESYNKSFNKSYKKRFKNFLK
ncbi:MULTISPECIES: class IIb bacteriocin, lactobin A/cerein 7B family [Paraclostridium]|uniref:Bacteriocin n=1 Tax=Paraclostridium benzoelyticum TaxID=1629550 RepID=A0A0M3DBT7_9FIRM|nr:MULTISPECIES: class IIb bacteriocin, lactobin A/cerein 7B family [Paraclostridium]KKY00130.1 hypothetical protein VN21_15940 [Paraclostridium benzoelyticum]MCE9676702.1 class IIb bacteriocin, lactobin A/cerein 7B family [Paraclostridium bifermentans]OXX83549.1 hypothetical protein AVM15_10230 [Paraclostridium benzoelyticum]TQO56318.1 class IIb bacteriocin, lactobin A/cerein 7B family [Paraclostridium bifermentans]